MEGKLIKEGNEYYLEDNLGVTIASTDKILLKETDTVKKLSLKNCQAIENGYDLDEVAKLSYECDPYIAEYLEQEFKRGFEKALEILGDKKFSELNTKIDSMVDFAKDNFTSEVTSIIQMFVDNLKVHIEKIKQPNEWLVEIVTEKFFEVKGNDGIVIRAEAMEEFGERNDYKLDAYGCLILKRKV